MCAAVQQVRASADEHRAPVRAVDDARCLGLRARRGTRKQGGADERGRRDGGNNGSHEHSPAVSVRSTTRATLGIAFAPGADAPNDATDSGVVSARRAAAPRIIPVRTLSQ